MRALLHAVAIGLIAAGAFLAMELWAPWRTRVVQAERFRLLDGAGVSVGELGLDETGIPRLMLEKGGIKRVELSGGWTPRLALFGQSGVERAELSLSGETVELETLVGLALNDEHGVRRAWIRVLPDGRPTIDLLDAEGRQRATLRIELDGAPHVEMFDCTGKSGLSLGTLGTGSCGVSFYDSARRVRARIWLVDDKFSFEQFDDNGVGSRPAVEK